MKKTFTKGFTLVETLVAITILIIGVLGPLALAARGISDGLFAQNQLTASLLAQEAIETIINRRNSNILVNPQEPFSGINSETSNVSIDGASGEIKLDDCYSDFGEGPGCFLKYVGGHYINSTNDTGQFFRQVSLRPGQDELRVDVLIIWSNKGVQKKFSLTEYVYGK